MTGALERVTEHARRELGKAIVGQAAMIDLVLLTVVCGGHALLEGVPGLAKTLTVRTLAHILRLRFQRVQGTPDLMPADIIGGEVFNMASGSFTMHPGPVFTDLLLVDEINRMPPRTQAALLEAMEERQVTIGGAAHLLSRSFTTLATQNPVEFEGTYPLPEAELDRFFVKITLHYPDAAGREEEEILERHHRGFDIRAIDSLELAPLEPEEVAAARREAAAVSVEPALFGYIATIARRTRDWPTLTLGASPRAAIHAGLPVPILTVAVFAISGALAGLAGATEVLGVHGNVRADWNPAYGLAVIPLVFLARFNGFASIAFVFLFWVLSIGGESAARRLGVPHFFTLVVIAILLVMLALAEHLDQRRRARAGG
jgi:MoxR-like ATPase